MLGLRAFFCERRCIVLLVVIFGLMVLFGYTFSNVREQGIGVAQNRYKLNQLIVHKRSNGSACDAS
jgi:hypothetical protein